GRCSCGATWPASPTGRPGSPGATPSSGRPSGTPRGPTWRTSARGPSPARSRPSPSEPAPASGASALAPAAVLLVPVLGARRGPVEGRLRGLARRVGAHPLGPGALPPLLDLAGRGVVPELPARLGVPVLVRHGPSRGGDG